MGILNKGRDVGAVSTDTLTQQELTFILKTLHDCKFDGKGCTFVGRRSQQATKSTKGKVKSNPNTMKLEIKEVFS